MFQNKMVIAVRKDVKMSPAKMAVQVGHAVLGCSNLVREFDENLYWRYFVEGQPKIVCEVQTLDSIYDLQEKCIAFNVIYYVVKDFGLTELNPDTVTCIGIGPDEVEKINKITKRLKLYK